MQAASNYSSSKQTSPNGEETYLKFWKGLHQNSLIQLLMKPLAILLCHQVGFAGMGCFSPNSQNTVAKRLVYKTPSYGGRLRQLRAIANGSGRDVIIVLACALSLIQGQISALHQRLPFLAMRGINTDTDAGGHAHVAALNAVGL